MDDLVEHFSGLGPDILGLPPVHQPPSEDAGAEPPRVDVSTPPPAATSSTTSTPLTSTTTLKDSRSSSPIAQPQSTATASKSGPARFAGDGTMDLDAYRELFRRQEISQVASVYGELKGQSTAPDGPFADYHDDDDDDDEGDYIRHFHDRETTVELAPPGHQLRQNLLSDLEDINSTSDSKHHASLDETNGRPIRLGVSGYHTAIMDVGNSDFDDGGGIIGDIYDNDDPSLKVTRNINSTNGVPARARSPAPIQSVDEMDKFSQRLRELHQQDMARDELLIDLHREVQDLRQALRAEARGSQSSFEGPELNPRGEAAARSLIEARQDMQKSPFVCVLIDGEGYDFHDNLLQSGKAGGVEAAERLARYIWDYVEKFNDSKDWDIIVYIYLDFEDLLNRCSTCNVSLSESSLRGFMRGFTQSLVGPLFNIVDVGRDHISRKIEGIFHLFANNVHCKRIFLGCCHDSSYAIALAAYTGHPLIAPRITLLVSGDNDECFESTGYEIIEFPYVFRPNSFSAKAAVRSNDTGDFQPGNFSSQDTLRTPSTRTHSSC